MLSKKAQKMESMSFSGSKMNQNVSFRTQFFSESGMQKIFSSKSNAL